MTLPAPLAGGLLADRYRLDCRIAVGGMGEVWRAEDLLLGRLVAVKTLRPEYVGDADLRARFRAEARHAGGLEHPGIASVYDFGELPSAAWLVMELVDGEPLSGLLHRSATLSADRTLDIVAQTAAALQVAHDAGIVHRDIKPGNLLIRPDGVVKVTDFGIASAADTATLTRIGELIGTAYYLSPEQAAGRTVESASDLYSLGVVAYECLAGQRPFSGSDAVAVVLAHVHEPVPALPDTVPEQVRALVTRLLSKDPSARYSSAAELSRSASALRDRLTDAPRPSPPRPSPPRPSPPGQPHRRAVRSAAVLLAVLAAGVGLRSAFVTDPAAPPAPGQARVSVTAQEWVGRPADEVRAALAARGLQPRVEYDGVDHPVNTVSAVQPVGDLAVGTPVVLHVVPDVEPDSAEDKPGGRSDDKRRGKRS
jgi:serine/threonine-protein kinase